MIFEGPSATLHVRQPRQRHLLPGRRRDQRALPTGPGSDRMLIAAAARPAESGTVPPARRPPALPPSASTTSRTASRRHAIAGQLSCLPHFDPQHRLAASVCSVLTSWLPLNRLQDRFHVLGLLLQYLEVVAEDLDGRSFRARPEIISLMRCSIGCVIARFVGPGNASASSLDQFAQFVLRRRLLSTASRGFRVMNMSVSSGAHRVGGDLGRAAAAPDVARPRRETP